MSSKHTLDYDFVCSVLNELLEKFVKDQTQVNDIALTVSFECPIPNEVWNRQTMVCSIDRTLEKLTIVVEAKPLDEVSDEGRRNES
jgi:hypothetical protein